MKFDTGQQLDIVHTTENLLVVTPKDDHTSMVITKIDNEFPCYEYHQNTTDDNHAIQIIIPLFTIAVSAYTLIVHLLFKKLRTLFGKLLIFYNLCVVSSNIFVIAFQLMHYWVKVNSQTISCHTATIVSTVTFTGMELFATVILSHLDHVPLLSFEIKYF